MAKKARKSGKNFEQSDVLQRQERKVGTWLTDQASAAVENKKPDADPWKGTKRTDVFEGSNNDDIAFGSRGDDIFIAGAGSDIVFAGSGNDFVLAEAGNDVVFGDAGDDIIFGQTGNDVLLGGLGIDSILGGPDNDVIAGGEEADLLAGGLGADRFVYDKASFARATFQLNPAARINVSSLAPDNITDFTTAEDQFVLVGGDLDLDAVNFQKGNSKEIAADGNVIVLTDPFANAAAAARAIADNNNIQADAGVFVYFNVNLGFSRLVHSADLSDGGDITVLANLTNQTGQNGITNLDTFSANNFAVV